MGAGIFVLTGHAAAANAGPAIVLSFVLGGLAGAFAGLCCAETASTVPISGSADTDAYATLGERTSHQIPHIPANEHPRRRGTACQWIVKTWKTCQGFPALPSTSCLIQH
jgi:amino acid transporter